VSPDRYQIEVDGIGVEVVRKSVKNVRLSVYPPDGRVRVAVPLRIGDDAVRLAVVKHLGWIRRKQVELAQRPRTPKLQMVTGESHYFEGRPYLLNVREGGGKGGVRLVGDTMLDLCVPPGCDRDARNEVLQGWYRQQLRAQVPSLLSKWEPRVGKKVAEVRIRRMKTRWGTCNIQAARVWLNLELIKKPVACLEYVLVHEMVHLHVRLHNRRFHAWMDRLMPTWRVHRDELNRAPLADEQW